MPTNCVNCGAHLTGSKCQYCGTEYKGNGVVADFGKEDCTGMLSVGGNDYSAYIGHIDTKMIDMGCGRTLDGTIGLPFKALIFTRRGKA